MLATDAPQAAPATGQACCTSSCKRPPRLLCDPIKCKQQQCSLKPGRPKVAERASKLLRKPRCLTHDEVRHSTFLARTEFSRDKAFRERVNMLLLQACVVAFYWLLWPAWPLPRQKQERQKDPQAARQKSKSAAKGLMPWNEASVVRDPDCPLRLVRNNTAAGNNAGRQHNGIAASAQLHA